VRSWRLCTAVPSCLGTARSGVVIGVLHQGKSSVGGGMSISHHPHDVTLYLT
jgi:hypothetical protein